MITGRVLDADTGLPLSGAQVQLARTSLGTIADSSAICAYIEKIHPESPLYPSDPYEYARALWYEEYCDTELIAQIGPGIFRAIQFKRFSGEEPDLETPRKVWR